MPKLTLYTNPKSRGRTARWMLEETGQPYEAVILDYGTTMKAPNHLALNPMGKVPTLVHGDAIVTEGAAICAYLTDSFPDAGLRPQNRAAFYRWLFFAAGPVEAAITNRALSVEVPPEKRGFVGYGCYEDVVKTLEHAVSQSPYICGDTFSGADVYVGAQIGYGLRFNALPATPALTTYWDRIKTRPALARAAAIDDALIAAKP